MTDVTAGISIVAELVRAFKAMAMYPAGHPSRVKFFHRLLTSFSSFLAHAHVMELKVEDGMITYGGQPLETKDGAGRFLARECFMRQISSLRFVEGLVMEDIETLFGILAMDIEAVRAAGGVIEIIRGKGSGSLQLEQVDYEGILGRRMDVTGESESHYVSETLAPAAPPEGSVDREASTPQFAKDVTLEMSQDEWLAVKLGELDTADSVASYKIILKDIMTSLKETGGLGMPHYTNTVLRHLGKYLLKQVPEEILQANIDAIRTLAQPSALEEIVAQLTKREQPDREIIEAILLKTQNVSLPVLLRRLAEENEPFGRRTIIGFLVRFGPDLKPHLDKWLRDDRWYVVRNALGLLQQVGGHRDSANVKTFLQHPHPKIRLEALRFLYRYPVPVDEGTMNMLLGDSDPEVQARAVYALGILMGSSGLQRLITIAKKPYFGEGDVGRREMAIKGIGREGGEKAVLFLSNLLRTRSILNADAGERIQKAAVDALLEIGGPRAVYTFRRSLSRLKGQALREVEDFLRREGGEKS